MIDIQKYPGEFSIRDIKLILDTRKHCGKGSLSDIFWYEYKILNHRKKDLIYDNICLSPYRITERIRAAAEKNIIEKDITDTNTIRPNIDYRTADPLLRSGTENI